MRYIKIGIALLILSAFVFQGAPEALADGSVRSRLYQTGLAYIKYFQDRAMDQASGFGGLTRSYQLYLGGHSPADIALIENGAISYDQTIIGRISLSGGRTDILDTYVAYFNQLSDGNNPLINANNNYYDGSQNVLNYGPYRAIRIDGRDVPGWWNSWDWGIDTGAAACLVMYALDGYDFFQRVEYRDLGVLFGDYILRLQDADGGIRYGPRGMFHVNGPDFFWNLKSTEQNERILCALDALYEATADIRYSQAADAVKGWLKQMYDANVHLFHTAATYNGSQWVKRGFDYVATDVTALAPLEMMFNDAYFGVTETARQGEVDAMFAAIEQRAAFLDQDNMPKLFRFSLSQTGDYGSVEWSSQMALGYLRAAQIHDQLGNTTKKREYLNKYNALVNNLDQFFFTPSDDPDSQVAPYASFIDGSVAGGVPTGTGYYTFNCQAALASAFYAFAKAGYDPGKVGGGVGVPQDNSVLNLESVPWYPASPPYDSSGAAVAQMIINFMRLGSSIPYSELSQEMIYEYAKDPNPYSGELKANEVDKALGHFDPYDSLVTGWADIYDAWSDGNPYQGYNFTVNAYDPNSGQDAINEYMRDICHWMAYPVNKEDWWRGGELVAQPNTPAAVPIYGNYGSWVTIKGYAASADPCPEPRTNPFYTPDFTVYGFWVKDPRLNGIGNDTYKTAAECVSTYFKPLVSTDLYNGKYIQVAEPPLVRSRANIRIKRPRADMANLRFIGIEPPQRNYFRRLFDGIFGGDGESPEFLKDKHNWSDLVDQHLLSDQGAVAAFKDTERGDPLFVRRTDNQDDYYLVPFGKKRGWRGFLTSGVIILDAEDGHFREASWTGSPEVFLPFSERQAFQMVRRNITSSFFNQLRRISYFYRSQRLFYYSPVRILYYNYLRLLSYLSNAEMELRWQPDSYSISAYRPYWQINANGYQWHVTQDGQVIPQFSYGVMLARMNANRRYMQRFLRR